MKKLALMGYSRSGKDTVAAILREELRPVLTLAFANEMKWAFHEMFPNIPWNPKPRMEYERFGKAMRDIDENVWINKVARNVDQNAKYSIIITDVRQPNEAKWCKENGFTLIYVNASDYVRRERANNETTFLPVLPSESEMWTIDSDYTIDNSGTREELEAQVATLLQKLGETK